ncbi:MAG: DivIVA domain-containing protein, partial [Paraclostridium sp.]
MLTPVEIENKEFKKGIRGYREDEVDEFLDIVKEDFENIYRENLDLKEKVRMYNDQINKYENIEETLKATLITAQTAAEDTCSAANKKAKIIVEEAELRSRQIIEQANNRVIEIRKEYDSLVKEFKIFRNKFKSLLEDEIRSVD